VLPAVLDGFQEQALSLKLFIVDSLREEDCQIRFAQA
jgi:hypothetical protein